ncbi:hypothetical protein Tco_0564383 [Tanacetum coccineum]
MCVHPLCHPPELPLSDSRTILRICDFRHTLAVTFNPDVLVLLLCAVLHIVASLRDDAVKCSSPTVMMRRLKSRYDSYLGRGTLMRSTSRANDALGATTEIIRHRCMSGNGDEEEDWNRRGDVYGQDNAVCWSCSWHLDAATRYSDLRMCVNSDFWKITVVTLVEEQMSPWKGNLPKLPIESNIVRLATTSIEHYKSMEIVGELEEPGFELIEWKTGRMGSFAFVRLSTLPTKGMRSIISMVSIGLEGFRPSILLLVVTVVIVAVILVVVIVAIVGVVIVVMMLEWKYKYYFVMSDSEDFTVTYTEVSSQFEDLSDIGYSRVDGLPMMLEDPYAEAALQAPPSPDYVPGPEYPPSPVYVPYVQEPVYPEFMPPEDEEDPEEDPADEGDDDDDDDESSDDDEDDDDVEEDEDEEEEEHPAPADSVPPPVHRVTARMFVRAQTPISLPSDT